MCVLCLKARYGYRVDLTFLHFQESRQNWIMISILYFISHLLDASKPYSDPRDTAQTLCDASADATILVYWLLYPATVVRIRRILDDRERNGHALQHGSLNVPAHCPSPVELSAARTVARIICSEVASPAKWRRIRPKVALNTMRKRQKVRGSRQLVRS